MSPWASLWWDTTLAGNTSLVLPGLGLCQNGFVSTVSAVWCFVAVCQLRHLYSGGRQVVSGCQLFQLYISYVRSSSHSSHCRQLFRLCVSHVLSDRGSASVCAELTAWARRRDRQAPAATAAKGACECSKNTLTALTQNTDPEQADCAWFGFLFRSECQPGGISPSSAGSY